jgi:6-phosphogluconolactonase
VRMFATRHRSPRGIACAVNKAGGLIVQSNLMYVGTYTTASPANGVNLFRRDPQSGQLEHLSEGELVNPSWLAFDPDKRYLFAVAETMEYQGKEGGGVASFSIDQQTGNLTKLSEQPTTGGAPCHLCTDPEGKFLFVANHEHGNVSMLPINSDGTLEPASDLVQHEGSGPGPTQTSPHAHCTVFDPAGERLMVVDKGIDKVMIYQVDHTNKKLVPADPPYAPVHSGAAPRHIVFHPSGRYAYVNGEADMTITAFRYDGAGTFEEVHYLSTLPDGADREGVSTAGIGVHPNGRFVYVSNRGHDSIAIFEIDQQSGGLTVRGHQASGGDIPRAFGIDPEGNYMYVGNQKSDVIVIFRIDPDTGQLERTGETTVCGAPVAFLFT